jgi:outer membrane protein TolC
VLLYRILLSLPLLSAQPLPRTPTNRPPVEAPAAPTIVLPPMPEAPPPPTPLVAPAVTWALLDVVDATLRAQPAVLAADAGLALEQAGQLATVASLDGILGVDGGFRQTLEPDSHDRIDDATVALSFAQNFATGTTFSTSMTSSRLGFVGPATSAATSASSLGASVSQALFRRALDGEVVQSSIQLVEAARSDRRHLVNALVLDSVLAYWRLAAAQRSLDVLRDAEERARRIERDTAALVAADEVPAAEIVQLRANVVDKARLRRDAEHDVVAARAALIAACGDALARTGAERNYGAVAIEFPALPAAPMEASSVAERAIVRRWDAVAARTRVGARKLAAGFAERNLAPRVDVAGTARLLVGAPGPALEQWATHPLNPRPGYEVGVTLGVALPIANMEARAASVGAAAASSLADAAARAVELTVRQQALTAIDELQTAADTVRLAADTVALSRAAVDNERLKRKAGVSTLIDVVLIEDRLTAAMLAELLAQVRYASVLAQAHFFAGSLDTFGREPGVVAASLSSTEGL